MAHLCHARGCKTPVKPEMLMCFRHWRMVPRNLQQNVWKHYRRGQCDDMNPSLDWHAAADAAIKAVFEKEYPLVPLARLLVHIGKVGVLERLKPTVQPVKMWRP